MILCRPARHRAAFICAASMHALKSDAFLAMAIEPAGVQEQIGHIIAVPFNRLAPRCSRPVRAAALRDRRNRAMARTYNVDATTIGGYWATALSLATETWPPSSEAGRLGPARASPAGANGSSLRCKVRIA
jgi:hypothetical protein